MMKEYEIKFEPVTIEGVVYPKYNIYYYLNGEIETKEFLGVDIKLDTSLIKIGYININKLS